MQVLILEKKSKDKKNKSYQQKIKIKAYKGVEDCSLLLTLMTLHMNSLAPNK
jgi:hypothetical protein